MPDEGSLSMTVSVRPYVRATDYDRVSAFLVRTYGQASGYLNWLQPIWAYMHFHTGFDEASLGTFGVWEDEGEIVAVAHAEHERGEVFFQIAESYLHLKEELVIYAEENLAKAEDGQRTLRFHIDETDTDFEALALARGYHRFPEVRRDMTCLRITGKEIRPQLPEGFALSDMAEDDDIRKRQRILHRGFNHSGEPPAEELAGQILMQSAPTYRRELNVVVKAPDGTFVAYCGMWYEPENRFGYIEPVATDPDFRRLGLAQAAVLEAVRRVGELGATVAYVGTGMPFYRSMGFLDVAMAAMWSKSWRAASGIPHPGPIQVVG